MAENDALSKFDFSKVTGGGLFVKFVPGESQVLRVLTVDPIVTNESYIAPDGEEILSTKFSFIVYNWTESKAQILKATANTAKRIGELHTDVDFGADIKKVDLKITPPAKGEIKAYEIQVLPKAKEMTREQIMECAAIKLEEVVKDGQRMSFYEPPKAKEHTPGVADGNIADDGSVVIEDLPEGDINLDDIPF